MTFASIEKRGLYGRYTMRWQAGSRHQHIHSHGAGGKSLDHLLNYGVVYLTLQTMKLSNLPPELFKTVYFTPWVSFGRRFATVTMVLLQ
jgi:hypothetical protein